MLSKKAFKNISLFIGWAFVIFFLMFVITYYEFHIPLLCFLSCAFLSCPLIKRLPIKIKLWIRIPLAFILFIIAILHIPEEYDPTENIKMSDIVEQETSVLPKEETDILTSDSISDDSLSEKSREDNAPEKESLLSEDEFKLQCKEYWHDDIFFSDTLSEGDYIKLNLFVEEARFFESDAAYVWPSSDLIKKYDLQKDFFYCGVQRKDEFSYVGGQINLFFSSQYECSSAGIDTGDHLVVYGEIIEFSTTSVDGYNYCSVIPRYIENNGQ